MSNLLSYSYGVGEFSPRDAPRPDINMRNRYRGIVEIKYWYTFRFKAMLADHHTSFAPNSVLLSKRIRIYYVSPPLIGQAHN